MSNEKIRTHTEWHSAQRELLSNYWRLKASMALIKCENGRMERYGSEKKRVNPPIGAIKDRLIGGFGGKSKSQTSITNSGIKAGWLGGGGLTSHDQPLPQPQQKTCFKCLSLINWTMTFSDLRQRPL